MSIRAAYGFQSAMSTSVGSYAAKTHLPELLDRVAKGERILITKRGKLVARLVPIGTQRASMRGAWKGSAQVQGDIVHVDWSSEFKAAR